MSETVLLTIAASLVATLFGLLVTILGWLGNKIYEKLNEMNSTMLQIAGDLHEKVNDLTTRVVKVEAHVDNCPRRK